MPSDEFAEKVLSGTPLMDTDLNEFEEKMVTPAAEAVSEEAPISPMVETEEDDEKETVALLTQDDVESAGKVKTAAIARLIALMIALINQALNVLGLYASLPVNEGVIDLVSMTLVVVAAVYCYWKNNSWSPEANIGDNIMEALKKSDFSISDILEIVASASKKTKNP